METLIIIWVIVSIIGMIACPIIAYNKGRSALGWFLIGLLLGLIALNSFMFTELG